MVLKLVASKHTMLAYLLRLHHTLSMASDNVAERDRISQWDHDDFARRRVIDKEIVPVEIETFAE